LNIYHRNILCDSHVLQCCLLFSTMPPEIVGEKMEPQKLFDSVNILLSLQVRISCIQMVTFVYLKLVIIPLYFLGFAPF